MKSKIHNCQSWKLVLGISCIKQWKGPLYFKDQPYLFLQWCLEIITLIKLSQNITFIICFKTSNDIKKLNQNKEYKIIFVIEFPAFYALMQRDMLWLKIQRSVSTSEITVKYKLHDINRTQDIYSAPGINLLLNLKGNVYHYSLWLHPSLRE